MRLRRITNILGKRMLKSTTESRHQLALRCTVSTLASQSPYASSHILLQSLRPSVQHVHPHHASAGVDESMPETRARPAIQRDSFATYPGSEQIADPHLLHYMWRICQGSAS